MEERPKKKGKTNFFAPNKEEQKAIKIKKMEGRIKKKKTI